jgi:hypothetical protein
MIHVCNVPSPAATASLEIGKEIADMLAKRFDLTSNSPQPRAGPSVVAW